ncbi:MAG: hypothetical protein GX491_16880 [Chloroflexi bacterium]|nr:hypothetical protein [Chloroflexota bacterium]
MKKSNLILYILLNIIISAATTLTVLNLWERARQSELDDLPPSALATQGLPTVSGLAIQVTPTPGPLPPADEKVIEIVSVIGAGDIDHEVVMLRRVGEGNLPMANWKLSGDRGSVYTFAEQPALVLYKDGAVMVYSRTGTDTATEVYWNRDEAAWHSGEQITLTDSEGNVRAVYTIP